jgi:PAS domain S-box-containing protein
MKKIIQELGIRPRRFSGTLEGIRNLVESSELPMNFADPDHIVLFCNRAMASLAGSVESEIIGRKALDLARLFKDRVPKRYRREYWDRQVKMHELSIT